MDQVAALLGSRYGLAVERLEPAPRGWTGETYAATARDGARFFVKVYPKDRLPRTAAAALPALAELHRLGLTQVSRPIPSTSGALHERLGDDLLVVFEYLDAVAVDASALGGDRLGDLIARVHQQTARVASPIARDLRGPLRRRAVAHPGGRALGARVADEPRRGLQRFLDEQGNAIADGWATRYSLLATRLPVQLPAHGAGREGGVVDVNVVLRRLLQNGLDQRLAD